MKLNIFKKKSLKEVKLTKENVMNEIEDSISSLKIYSTSLLENVLSYEYKLQKLVEFNNNLIEQSKSAINKENNRLYTKALNKITENENEATEISKSMVIIQKKLTLILDNIKSLEKLVSEEYF